ncbi:hypothetical protein CY35_07G038400 [Sphagnum magellanicum]|uniref:Uncharacterized protein n=1 Tax=Sphagnum magellanicum TaxID=128215 RepID=A0ACB8HK47_9BRYO|nr:hypothetical protein CY35_07G038400 [Sphagnum magellanicum]
MAKGGAGLFTGFTRLSKGLAVLLAIGFLLTSILPSTVEYLALIPGRSIPFVWTVLTAGYLERSIFSLIVSIAALLIVGRLLEPFWGSKEFLKFIFFVNFFASANTFVLAVFLYYVSRRGDFLYVSVSGFHGVLAGFLVAVKQIMPDQEVPFLLKLRAKWLPSMFVLSALIASIILNEPMHFVPFIVFGTYGAWLYLRYLQRKPEAGFKGDASSEFALTTFFPGFLQPLVDPVFAIFEKIFCGRRNQVLEEGQDFDLGKPLPGSDPVEANRRRERGARALEERLGSVTKAETKVVSTENLPSSLENEDMV